MRHLNSSHVLGLHCLEMKLRAPRGLLYDRKLIANGIVWLAFSCRIQNWKKKEEKYRRVMWMLALVRANWIGGNYNGPQNGLDKDWYCNKAFISISFLPSLRCVCVCVCVLGFGLVCLKAIWCMNCLMRRNERAHMEVCGSVNGFTVKLGEIGASENIIMVKWGEKGDGNSTFGWKSQRNE